MNIYLRNRMVMVAALLIAGAFFSGSTTANSEETLVITGTGSSIGTMKRMAGDFQRKFPRTKVEVLPSIGSTGAIKAVKEGKIHIGLSARPLKPEEQVGEIKTKAYGRTAFIFGVQGSNDTKGLTLREIEDIYAGKRKTWTDGTPVRIILRPLSDAYSTFLASINSRMKSAHQKAHSIPDIFVGNTDQEAARQIEKTPGSFGTTSGAVIAAEQRKIKALSVDGTAPTLANVSTGRYPYVMTLFLVYREDMYKGATKDFVTFVFSEEGQRVLSENGHVNLPRAFSE